ncbi:MAG: type 1 glutamine amidotransferase [Actinomycetota bacterium]
MSPIAIVQHESSVPPGLVADVLESESVDYFIVDAPREAAWPSIDDIDGLVVLGGTMNVDQLDDYPFLARSRELMKAAIDHGRPTLGVCLGAQMMARALGAEVRRAGSRNALFSSLELTEEGNNDALISEFPEIPVLQFHEDTFDVPQGAVLLAVSRVSGLPMAFRWGTRAYAVQFHFEVDSAIVGRWIENVGTQTMVEEWGCLDGGRSLQDAEQFVGQASAGERLVKHFLQLVGSGATSL